MDSPREFDLNNAFSDLEASQSAMKSFRESRTKLNSFSEDDSSQTQDQLDKAKSQIMKLADQYPDCLQLQAYRFETSLVTDLNGLTEALNSVVSALSKGRDIFPNAEEWHDWWCQKIKQDEDYQEDIEDFCHDAKMPSWKAFWESYSEDDESKSADLEELEVEYYVDYLFGLHNASMLMASIPEIKLSASLLGLLPQYVQIPTSTQSDMTLPVCLLAIDMIAESGGDGGQLDELKENVSAAQLTELYQQNQTFLNSVRSLETASVSNYSDMQAHYGLQDLDTGIGKPLIDELVNFHARVQKVIGTIDENLLEEFNVVASQDAEEEEVLETDVTEVNQKVDTAHSATQKVDKPKELTAKDIEKLSRKTRVENLAKLREISEHFKLTEPHSPVPFLIEKAVRWANLPLDELMNELLQENEETKKSYANLTGVKFE